MLDVRSIHVFYGAKHIIKDTSFSIGNGERLLLLGPNGAGKSTLLKAIAGLIPVKQGAIEFMGQKITGFSAMGRVKAGISYLLQSNNIVPDLTVEENLSIAAYGLKKDEFTRRLNEVFSVFDFLGKKLKRRAGFLSGGERQALAVSMVLIKRPKLILLDEPTAGLSPKTANEMLEHIKKVSEVVGIDATCMVEHNLRYALPWATRVLVIVSGRVVYESDKPQNFIDNPEELEKFFF